MNKCVGFLSQPECLETLFKRSTLRHNLFFNSVGGKLSHAVLSAVQMLSYSQASVGYRVMKIHLKIT